MEEPLTVQEGVVIPGAELWFTASRSGGPGGQHVNKTSSRVTLHFDVAHSTAFDDTRRARVVARLARRLTLEGVLLVDVDSERSQHRNREIARERLAEILRAALREPRSRRPTRATRASRLRRLKSKTLRGALKDRRKRPRDEEK
jgi:ribosome-associated protein